MARADHVQVLSGRHRADAIYDGCPKVFPKSIVFASNPKRCDFDRPEHAYQFIGALFSIPLLDWINPQLSCFERVTNDECVQKQGERSADFGP